MGYTKGAPDGDNTDKHEQAPMSEPATDRPPRRILLLSRSDEMVAEWSALLGPHGMLRVVRDGTEAEAVLAAEPFDVVLIPSTELLPLTTDAGRKQARAILDEVGQGICSVDRQGNLLWTNAAMRSYSAETIDALRQSCAELIPTFLESPSQATFRKAVTTGQRQHFDLTVTALPGPGSQLDRVVGLVCDTTGLNRMRERLDAIDAAGRELVALEADDTAGMEVPQRLQLLEDRVISYCRDLLDFTHFAVLVLDPKTEQLEFVLMGGFPEQAKGMQIRASRMGNGISGYVAATGESYICSDVSKDPLYLSGMEAARSSLTVPLRLNERIVGVLNVESDMLAAFNDEDRQVAEIFGRYIAAALQMLKLLVFERSETTGQLAADVRAEVSEPLNDIVTEATRLLQSEALSPEDRRRLQNIVDRVDQIKQAVQAVTEPRAIRGLLSETSAVDPALRGKRVLVADDEDIIRETIADVLAKAGALPVMARDGEEAVVLLRSQHFDLVLSDIKMPYRNGYEVFAATKEANPACPVILITGFGYDPEHSIVRASREGLSGVLFKPFKVEQLMDMVHKAVAVDSPS